MKNVFFAAFIQIIKTIKMISVSGVWTFDLAVPLDKSSRETKLTAVLYRSASMDRSHPGHLVCPVLVDFEDTKSWHVCEMLFLLATQLPMWHSSSEFIWASSWSTQGDTSRWIVAQNNQIFQRRTKNNDGVHLSDAAVAVRHRKESGGLLFPQCGKKHLL